MEMGDGDVMDARDRSELELLRAEVRVMTRAVDGFGTKMDGVALDIKEAKEAQEAVNKDVEGRLRGYEKWKNSLPLATLFLLITTSMGLIVLFARG